MLKTAAIVLASLLLVALIGGGAAAAVFGVQIGDGEAVTQERRLDAPFERVDARGSADVEVEVRAGERPVVTVHAGSKTVDDVQTSVEDGVLVVDQEDGWGDAIEIGVSTPRVVIVAPRLAGAALDGSGDLTLDAIDAESFEVLLDGSGDVEARGRAGTLTATLDGSGDLDLRGLQAERATATLDGSGDLDVVASDTLDLTLDGSGDLTYGGTAQVSEHLDGSGDITRDD